MFNSLEKRKEKIDQEVAKYQIEADRKKLKIDEEVERYRQERHSEIQQLAIQCARQQGSYEHEFHSGMEKLKIEIAKLEALKETMQNDVTFYKKLVEEKDKEILRAHEVNLKLAEQKTSIYR